MIIFQGERRTGFDIEVPTATPSAYSKKGYADESSPSANFDRKNNKNTEAKDQTPQQGEIDPGGGPKLHSKKKEDRRAVYPHIKKTGKWQKGWGMASRRRSNPGILSVVKARKNTECTPLDSRKQQRTAKTRGEEGKLDHISTLKL